MPVSLHSEIIEAGFLCACAFTWQCHGICQYQRWFSSTCQLRLTNQYHISVQLWQLCHRRTPKTIPLLRLMTATSRYQRSLSMEQRQPRHHQPRLTKLPISPQLQHTTRYVTPSFSKPWGITILLERLVSESNFEISFWPVERGGPTSMIGLGLECYPSRLSCLPLIVCLTEGLHSFWN